MRDKNHSSEFILGGKGPEPLWGHPSHTRSIRSSSLDEYVRRLVDLAPPLSFQQRARLSLLLTQDPPPSIQRAS